MSRVLVLDQSYQPHRIVSWQRAVTMLFQGKVEIVEEYDEDIRSVHLVIKMPAVVRLLRKVSRKRAVKFSRINVATRDDFRCFGAGTRVLMSDGRQLAIEDVRPGDRVVDAFGDPQSVLAVGRRIADNAVTVGHRGSAERTVTTPEHPFLSSTGKFVPIGDRPEYLVFPRVVKYEQPYCADQLMYECSRALPSDRWLRLREGRIFWTRRSDEAGIPAVLTAGPEMAYLMGLYAAEGSATLQGLVAFSFHSDERSTLATDAERLVRDLWGTNVAVDVHAEKHLCVVRTCSKAMLLVLRALCGHGSHRKRVPWQLIGPHHSEFLRGLVRGDGCVDKKRSKVSLTMTSYDVVFGAQSMLWGLGIYPSVQIIERPDRKTAWSLVLQGENYVRFMSNVLGDDCGNGCRIFGDDQFVYRKLQDVTPIEGDITVFNLEIAGSHSYIANGLAVHNCQYCGVKKVLRKLTYDHVVPRAQGGRTTWENVTMACAQCNAKKRDRTPEQAGMRLRTKPVKPKSLPVVVFRIDPQATIPDQWASWVYWHGALEEGA